MFLHILYPYIKFIIGTLYPSYKTWKSLKRKDETNRRLWMKYWVNFGAFQMMELFSDITLGYILPFYVELKILVILWMVMGTKLLFDTVVNRELARREKSIDKWLNKIAKCRNEILAILWLELSQCTLKVVSALMTGGLSFLLVSSPDNSKVNTPENSDNEYEDEKMDVFEEEPAPRRPLTRLSTKRDVENTILRIKDEPSAIALQE